ncbi:MAG: SDR family oxidoreductase [Chloroflexota bacterium]|nr:SDR family oxidoreductase [Chloroflexota bacterium]
MPITPLDDRRVALVTGASSGIGLELARLLAADGMRLVLVARDAAKLDSVAQELGTAGWPALTIAQDLAAPNGVDRVMAHLDGIDVDVLVNNAGYAIYGAFAETALEAELAMLQVNVMALTALTKRLLPGMVARGRGRILNLGSTAAFLPGPLMTAYHASKAYVLSFSEGLAEELRGTGVTVTVLCPGPTRTGFQQRAAMEESRLIKAVSLQSAADVARAGYEGMMAGKTVVVPSWSDRITSIAPRFVPRALVPRLVKRAQEPER